MQGLTSRHFKNSNCEQSPHDQDRKHGIRPRSAHFQRHASSALMQASESSNPTFKFVKLSEELANSCEFDDSGPDLQCFLRRPLSLFPSRLSNVITSPKNQQRLDQSHHLRARPQPAAHAFGNQNWCDGANSHSSADIWKRMHHREVKWHKPAITKALQEIGHRKAVNAVERLFARDISQRDSDLNRTVMQERSKTGSTGTRGRGLSLRIQSLSRPQTALGACQESQR